MKSIFQEIEDNIMPNGMLASTFHIEKYRRELRRDLRFTDGMIDFLIYSELDRDLLEYLKKLTTLLEEENILVNTKLVEEYFSKNVECRVLGTMDTYLHWIRENKTKFQANLIYKWGFYLAFTTSEIEAVKLGISLLTLFDYLAEEKIIEGLEKLSLCEEFTMYTNVVLYHVQNGNEIRFRLAKKLNGYGKIHLINALQVENKIIEEWLLCYGCQNKIDNSYLALTIANKIDLPRLVSEKNLTFDEWNGLYEIVIALLKEELNQGISVYRNRNPLFAAILLKYPIWKTDIKYYDLLTKMREYWLQNEKTNPMLEKVNQILQSTATATFLKLVIQQPKEMEIGIQIITKLPHLDFYAEIYEAYHKNPKEYFSCISYLMQKKKIREAVIKDWVKATDLGSYIGEPKPLLQMNEEIFELVTMIQLLENYPNLGAEIIVTGLSARAMYPRNAALHTIAIWKKKTKKELPKEIQKALQTLQKKEVIKVYKEQINHLLGIKEDLSKYIEPSLYDSEEEESEKEEKTKKTETTKTESEKELPKKIHLFHGDIQSLFRDIIATRGEDYYQNGMVRQCMQGNERYIAFVQGSQFKAEYEVVIKVDSENKIQWMQCNCPYPENCKHEYATLLYIRNHYEEE